MKFNIGENLKKLRLSKGLTQEQLAEVFCVSPQAISRWENNISYPDITMLPGIAVFYETTIDSVIGMDDIRKSENINKIHGEVYKLVANNQVDDAIELIKEGLKLCPNNSGLLLSLAENFAYKSNDIAMINEGISLLERALRLSDISMKAKSTATVNLIFLYLKLNNVDRVNVLIKSLPHIWESREVLMPETYTDKEYTPELKKSITKALVFFYNKIKDSEKRKYGEIPNYFQLGANFELKESIDEIIGTISDFLNE